MPIYKDRKRGTFLFEFDRVIGSVGRVRARKRLPKAWTQAQADAYDRKESARLYAEAARSAPSLPERDHLTRQAARLNAQLRS